MHRSINSEWSTRRWEASAVGAVEPTTTPSIFGVHALHQSEGVTLGLASRGGFDLVGELETDRDRQVQTTEVTPRFGRALPYRTENTSAVSGKKDVPIQPSASSPVTRRLAGPSEAI